MRYPLAFFKEKMGNLGLGNQGDTICHGEDCAEEKMPGEEELRIHPKSGLFDGGSGRDGLGSAGGGVGVERERQGWKKGMRASWPEPAPLRNRPVGIFRVKLDPEISDRSEYSG